MPVKPDKAVLVLVAAIAGTASGCGDEPPDSPSGRSGDRAAPRVEGRGDQLARNAERKSDATLRAIGDMAITAKIKSAFIAEPELAAMSIDVDTAGGKVTLKGSVPAPEKAQRAREIASAVGGVKSVDSELKVESPD